MYQCEKKQLSTLEHFILARWTYSIGEPLYTDAEYSVLLRYLESSMPDNEYLHRSWSSDPCPVELLKDIDRLDLVKKIILADKTESIASLDTEYAVYSELHLFEGLSTVSMKHDGWNVQANYYNGQLITIHTRGRSSDAVDASVLCQLVPDSIPASGPIKIVMEATVSRTNYGVCRQLFDSASQRSAVSSVLARPEYVHLISLHAFDIHGYDLAGQIKFKVLQDWGFDVPMYYIAHDYNEILKYVKLLSDAYNNYEWPTDGAVFDGNKRRAIRLLAWEQPLYQSYITGYLEQYNMFRISPSLLIEPVLRGGTIQRRINITNWQRIIDNNLKPGSPVAFKIASSAIANIDLDTTRLLQKQWAGKYDEFKHKIQVEEEAKRRTNDLLGIVGYVC